MLLGAVRSLLGGADSLVRLRLSSSLFALIAAVWIAVELQTAYGDVMGDAAFVFDWDAYMEQAAMIEGGERNYSNVRGDTGPLVYPGGHALLHVVMRRAYGWDTRNWTTEYGHSLDSKPPGYDHRTHRPDGVIRSVQLLYVGLYGATLAVSAGLFRVAGVSWVWMPVLAFGRRARNIYGLGLFNDCWAMLFALSGVLCAGTDSWSAATLLLSAGVSVKMNVLLFLPAYGVLVARRHGFRGVMYHGALGAAVQLACAAPFLLAAPGEYVAGAFNLGRVFTHRWSVNWQHVPEDVFLHPWFSAGLLAAHLLLLASVAASQWRDLAGGPGGRLRGAAVVRTLLLCNFVGVVCARSLHYQFLIWYWWALPVVAGTTAVPVFLAAPVVVGLEMAWNVHEPEPWSAAIVTLCHLLLLGAQVAAPRVAPDVSAAGHPAIQWLRRTILPRALFSPR